MAHTGRRVIFYDQLGGGASSHPHNPSMWSIQLFVEELDAIRKALTLNHLHILGQSWGGVLGDDLRNCEVIVPSSRPNTEAYRGAPLHHEKTYLATA